MNLLDAVALHHGGPAVGEVLPQGGWGVAESGRGDVIGCQALLDLLGPGSKIKAMRTTTIAFVTHQWLGGRGLNRLLSEIHPDEFVFVGRITGVPAAGAEGKESDWQPASGVLIGFNAETREKVQPLLEKFKALADQKQIPIHLISAPFPRMASYARSASLPDRFVQLGVPLLWPVTPAEFSAARDEEALRKALEGYLEIESGARVIGDAFPGPEPPSFKTLVEAYGASGHEGAVREEVGKLLPEWAQKKLKYDPAGNLVLHIGENKSGATVPRIVFVAHTDEIGYEVKKIEDDGRLQVDVLGGGYPQYFLGHVVLVHKKDGTHMGGVLELPNGWDKAGFEFPSSMRSMDEPAHVYVGTKDREETEKLGIGVGDFVTIPKQYAVAGDAGKCAEL